ncbi:MAG: GDSL-type esterase/lipase family protein [Myxococcota bacterium]
MILALALTILLSQPPDPPPDAVLPPSEPVDHTKLGVAMPIENPRGQHALAHFFHALEDTARRVDDPDTATREDQARIVVFGASHVAGDMFTSVIRDRLKARYGDAGIGFVVPANPWRDYYNHDANISFSDGWDSWWVSKKHDRDDNRYGLAGVTFQSSTAWTWAKVSTSRENEFGRNIDHIEVWFWRQPKGGDFVVELDGRRAKRVKTKPNPKKHEAEGLAYWTLDVPYGRHEVKLKPVGNGPVMFFGMALDSKKSGVVMDSMGINGARATDQMQWDAGIFTEQLQRRDPDLVILAYGTNDIGDDEPIREYEKKLDIVVNRVHSAVPQASCLFIGPSDRPVKVETQDEDGEEVLMFQRRPRQSQVIDVQKEVAHRYGCGYWNWAAAMGGDLSMLRWVHADTPFATPDYVHMTKAGYQRIADLFWDAFMGPYDLERLELEPSIHDGPTLKPH